MGFNILLALTILVIAVAYATENTEQFPQCTPRPRGDIRPPGVQHRTEILLPGSLAYNVTVPWNACTFNGQRGLKVKACGYPYAPVISQISENLLWAIVVRNRLDIYRNLPLDATLTQYCRYNSEQQTISGEENDRDIQ